MTKASSGPKPIARLGEQPRETPSGCWLWCGAATPTGYGRISVAGTHLLVHRAAYNELVGTIPDEPELDHLCTNKWCWNPAHLEAVAHHLNVLRAHGHPDPLPEPTTEAKSELLVFRATAEMRRELDELCRSRPEYSRGGVVRRALADWLDSQTTGTAA